MGEKYKRPDWYMNRADLQPKSKAPTRGANGFKEKNRAYELSVGFINYRQERLPDWVGNADHEGVLWLDLRGDTDQELVFMALPSGKQLVHDGFPSWIWTYCKYGWFDFLVIGDGEESITMQGFGQLTFGHFSFNNISTGNLYRKLTEGSVSKIQVGFNIADVDLNKNAELFTKNQEDGITWFDETEVEKEVVSKNDLTSGTSSNGTEKRIVKTTLLVCGNMGIRVDKNPWLREAYVAGKLNLERAGRNPYEKNNWFIQLGCAIDGEKMKHVRLTEIPTGLLTKAKQLHARLDFLLRASAIHN